MDTIDAVKQRHTPRLMALPGVVGVGLGQSGGRDAIVVMVRDRARAPALEPTLEGFPVIIREVGAIRPLGG